MSSMFIAAVLSCAFASECSVHTRLYLHHLHHNRTRATTTIADARTPDLWVVGGGGGKGSGRGGGGFD